MTEKVAMAVLFLAAIGALSLWFRQRARKPAQWVDIPGDPLTLAHREILAEVMRRKLAGTLAQLDRPDVDAIFLRVKAETGPKSDTPPREAHRLITSLPRASSEQMEADAPPRPRLILTDRGGR